MKLTGLTPLEPQSRFGDIPHKFQVVCLHKRDCSSIGVKKHWYEPGADIVWISFQRL